MRLIDDKGRLFGKINLIDFLVILFMICSMPLFYYMYKVVTKESSVTEEAKVSTNIEIDCRFIELTPELLTLIAVGDKEVDSQGNVIGEISWLGQAKPYKYKFSIRPGEVLFEEDDTLKELAGRLKLKAKIKDSNLFYKDRQISADAPIEFKTGKYSLIALSIFEKVKKLDLFVVFKDLKDDVLKLLSEGDKEFDEDGDVVAEILSIGNIENDSYEIDLGGGNFVLGKDSNKKQVCVKMSLKCVIKNNKQIYFKDKRILYNTPFEFKTDEYILEGVIAKTYESEPPKIQEKWIHTQVKFSGVIPELSRVITEGDTEEDVTGETIGKIISIVNNKLSEVLVLRKDEFVTISHPFYKDIIVDLDVLCIEKEGVPYFKNYPVKIGNAVTFTTKLYSISGNIVGFRID